MYLKVADFNVKVNNHYKYLLYLCQDYIVDEMNEIDFEIDITEDEITDEYNKTTEKFDRAYIEAIICYRKLCLQLPKYDAFLLHGATIDIEGNGFLFCAKSGTGKTTHTMLLKDYLKDKMKYVNGDKPIIRFIDGIPYAYGTPWNGKEGYGDNSKSPVKAIIFIERSENNQAISLEKNKVLSRIIHQILIPEDVEQANKTFELLDKMVNMINAYVMKCNMDKEAAVISYNEIIKNNI